jgi:hypothetical protein
MIIHNRTLVINGEFVDWVRNPNEYDIDYNKTVVLVIDTWNDVSNYDSKLSNLNEFLNDMRDNGSVICFSPYGAEGIYRNHPCRERVDQVLSTTTMTMPKYTRVKNVQRPVKVPHLQGKVSDQWINVLGSKIGIGLTSNNDYSIHPQISIDSARDIIAWKIKDILTYFKSLDRTVETVIFCGKHANWCILNRAVGMEEWKRYGFEKLIVKKDCVTCTNDPRSPPYCSQEEMDELHFRYIESYWGYTM